MGRYASLHLQRKLKNMTIQNPHSPVAIRIVILRGGFLRKIQLFSFFINDITPKKSKTKKKLIFQKNIFHPLSPPITAMQDYNS